jgi:competence protein ComEC
MLRYVKRPLVRQGRRAIRIALWPIRTATRLLIDERDRWFLWVPPLFALGIAIYFNLLTEPGWATVLAPFVLALNLRFVARGVFITVGLNVLLIIAAGILAAKIRTEWVRAPILSQTLRSATVTGFIERNERRSDKSQRITLRVVSIANLKKANTPQRVRIRVRKSTLKLSPGDTIRITARLTPPPQPTLPRGYDFARAAYFKGIGAVGFALSPPNSILLQGTSSWLAITNQFLQKLRRRIGDRIEAILPGEVGHMANALMTGERSGISRATNDLYRAAGIFHILSISGLHMAIMGGSVFVAIRLLLASIPVMALRYPIKKWSALAAAFATFAYLLISGGAHPTVRSFIMITVMFLAILLDRPALALRNVAIAALLILAVTPESLFNAGFQLSFAAVVGLISAYEAISTNQRRRRRLGLNTNHFTGSAGLFRAAWLFVIGTVGTTLIAGLATAPFAAFHFHAGQLYSMLTNMLAIPVSNLLVMPAALLAFIAMPFGAEAVPLVVMGMGIELMTWAAGKVAALPGAVIAIPAFSEAALQLMIFGGLWFCLWRRRWRSLGVLCAIAGIYSASLTPQPVALVGRNGKLVALRDQQGRLAAKKIRYTSFELRSWMENDGDTRSTRAATSTSGGRSPFRCDLEGCTGLIGKHLVAIPRSPAALVDDCKRADLLVITFPKPPGCVTGAKVLDYKTMRTQGTHAIYLESDGAIRFETVNQFRGARPWTPPARQKRYRARTATAHRQSTKRPTGTVRSRHRHTSGGERLEINDGRPLYWHR